MGKMPEAQNFLIPPRNFKCILINQNVVINGSDVIDTSDKVWIVQNGKYLFYPEIDC